MRLRYHTKREAKIAGGPSAAANMEMKKFIAVPLLSLMPLFVACDMRNDRAPTMIENIQHDAANVKSPEAECSCECKCPPCEKAVPPRPLTLSEKLDQVTEKVDEFFGGKNERGRYKLFKEKNFSDYIRFLDNSRFKNRDNTEGGLMFPGIAKALRECPYYKSDETREKIARTLLHEFGRRGQSMPAVLELMERMPLTITAQVASLGAGVGDKNRIGLRRIRYDSEQDDEERGALIKKLIKARGKRLSIAEKINNNASFLVQLGRALEEGKGVEKIQLDEEAWHKLDQDLAARIIPWPVKLWWVDEQMIWDITITDQLARYVCARMSTHFHNEISEFGKKCPSHLYHYRRLPPGVKKLRFSEMCVILRTEDCPDEPLAALEQ